MYSKSLPVSIPACKALYRDAAARSSALAPCSEEGGSLIRVCRSSAGTSTICCVDHFSIHLDITHVHLPKADEVRSEGPVGWMSEPGDLFLEIRCKRCHQIQPGVGVQTLVCTVLFAFEATYIELHSISSDLQVNVIQLHERFVDMGQNLSCSIIRFQESMDNGLEFVLVPASKIQCQLTHRIQSS